MKQPLFMSLFLLLLTGCSATWSGIKQDSSNAFDWTKRQVNTGAGYVKEKTE
jgi:uncharacterized protein YcfL